MRTAITPAIPRKLYVIVGDQRLRRVLTIVLLAVIALLIVQAVWPLWLGWKLGSDDGDFHLVRLFELDQAVRAGLLYPRLAPDLALGYGYPVFNYYPPLAAYLGEAGKIAGLSFVSAYDGVYIFSLVLGACGMFVLARRRFGVLAAAAGAAAYGLAPYQLTDVLVRGAQAETLAAGLFPWVLVAFETLARSPRARTAVVSALALALLMLAHNITAVLGLPLVAGYYALIAWEQRAARPLSAHALWFGLAVLLAMGLGAFYWLPALWERDLVRINIMTEGFFHFTKNFHDPQTLIQTTFSYDYAGRLFRPGLVQMVVASLGFAVALRSRLHRRKLFFFGAVIAITLWMHTSASQFLWEAIPFSVYVQFPWRTMLLTTVATAWLTAALVGCAGSLLSPARPEFLRLARTALVCAVIAVSVLASRLDIVTGPENYTYVEPSLPSIVRREANNRLVAVTTQGEYLPAGVKADIFDYGGTGGGPSEVPASSDARIRINEASPSELHFSVQAAEPARLVLDQFYFPGWKAETGEGSLPVEAWGSLGLLSIQAPPGSREVALRLEDTPVRSVSGSVSLLALGTLILLSCYPRAYRLRRLAPLGTAAGPVLLLLAIWGTSLVAREYLPGALAGVIAGVSGNPTEQVPVQAMFGEKIDLAGAQFDRTRLDETGALGLTLYWHTRSAPGRDYRVHVRLLDAAGGVVGERLKRPMFGLRRTAFWEPGMVVRDYHELRLAPGIPAGRYQVAVSLIDEQTGEVLPVRAGAPTGDTDGAKGPAGVNLSELHLGSVVMPAFQPAEAPVTAHRTDASFAGKLRISGFELETPTPSPEGGTPARYLAAVTPGDTLRLRLVFEALADMDKDYWVYIHLLDSDEGLLSQKDEQPTRRRYPTSVWNRGDVFDERFELSVPRGSAPGAYTLVTGLYDAQGLTRLPLDGNLGDRLTLGTVKVLPIEAPGPYEPLAGPVLWGNWANLDGFRAERTDNRLDVRLLWSARGRATGNYSVFVHVVDQDGRLVAQHDGQPANGAFPTSIWDPGDLIEDAHEVLLPPAAACGEYQIIAGLYLLENGERLRLEDGRDSVVVGRAPAARVPCGG